MTTIPSIASDDATRLNAETKPAADVPFLRLGAVSKSFGSNVVLESITIDVVRGEFMTLLGESGSGKTTLLRILAGFEEADSGEILLNGLPLQQIPAQRRPVNTVFQSYALFPHMTVFENVAYGLRMRGCGRQEIEQRVLTSLKMVKMEKFAGYAPQQISGGQKQRIALARALVNEPQALLLDEPLSALDANLRSAMQQELKALQQQLGITFLFVTHDQEEAMALSDRIVLLNRGRIEQCGTPREIYIAPRTPYVASFVGKSNVLYGMAKDGIASCGPFRLSTSMNGPVAYSLRPECVRLASGSQDSLSFRASIEMRHFQGANVLLILRCDDGTLLSTRLPSSIAASTGNTEMFTCHRTDFVTLELS